MLKLIKNILCKFSKEFLKTLLISFPEFIIKQFFIINKNIIDFLEQDLSHKHKH